MLVRAYVTQCHLMRFSYRVQAKNKAMKTPIPAIVQCQNQSATGCVSSVLRIISPPNILRLITRQNSSQSTCCQGLSQDFQRLLGRERFNNIVRF
ncbi:hypothetical protein NSP_35950 [Nodularia spumigena CCY9414]|nr:hypothetical protein NSP_35950 [Nodularia spumigena CCY9414]